MNETSAAFDRAAAWAASGSEIVINNLSGLFGPFSRFYLPYVAVCIAIAVMAYLVNRKHMGEAGKKGVLQYIFDPRVYFMQSSLVDLKVTFANRVFTPLIVVFQRGAVVASAVAVASLLTGGELAEGSADPGYAALVALTLVIILASDFTTYWVHRLHHELPVLWPYHRLHHTAETLTPLTFARKHPVYDLTRALSNIALVGPVQGLIFALFGVSSVATILGVNIVTAVFYWSGANLRHSHVWLSYGPLLNRVLVSPAQHQIHHSCAPRHHDKNYGEIFALWDWMFGTLYNPKGYEALEFGVADSNGQRIEQLHPTLRAAYLEPFAASFAALRDNQKDDSDSPAIART